MIRFLWAFGLLALSTVAAAEPVPPLRELFSEQPKGLGEQIAAWKFIYLGETFGNVSGGLGQGAVYNGLAKFGVGLNLEKLTGWAGASFYANTILPHGASISQKYVGDLNGVSNLDTVDGARLYKLWFQQVLDEGRWSLRLGQIAADKECFVSEGAALFLNNAFGTFPVISANLSAPIFPLSAPGFRGRWAPDDAFSVTGMVFAGDVGTAVSNPHNTHWRFRGQDGWLGLLELALHLGHEAGVAGKVEVGHLAHLHLADENPAAVVDPRHKNALSLFEGGDRFFDCRSQHRTGIKCQLRPLTPDVPLHGFKAELAIARQPLVASAQVASKV